MSSHDAFRYAICQCPEDLTPRLIYADWLDERDDAISHAHAEFIRLQVESIDICENSPSGQRLRLRQRDLLKAHGDDWIRRTANCEGSSSNDRGCLSVIHGWHFNRGFIEAITIEAEEFLRHGEELVRRFPLTQIRFRLQRSDRNTITKLSESEYLQNLTAIEFEPVRYGESGLGNLGLRTILQSSHLHQIRRLHLDRQNLTNHAIRLLIEWPGLLNLQRLDLSRNQQHNDTQDGMDGDGIAQLLGTQRLRNLEWLKLDQIPIGIVGVDAFTVAGRLDKLRSLSLERCRIGSHGVQTIAQSPALPQLTTLDLRGNQVGVRGVQALAASLTLRSLETIDLSSNRISDAGVVALARSQQVGGLRSLILRRNRLGDEGARALANTGPLAHLHTLDLRCNEVGYSGAEAIALSTHLPSLSILDLRENHIRPEDRSKLRKHLGKNLGRL